MKWDQKKIALRHDDEVGSKEDCFGTYDKVGSKEDCFET